MMAEFFIFVVKMVFPQTGQAFFIVAFCRNMSLLQFGHFKIML